MTHLHQRRAASLDMTVGAIWPVLLQFTIPLLLGNLFQLLYNTVDGMVVGNFVGRPALASVSATTQICNTLVKFFNGISIGAGAVISRHFGAKDPEKLHAVLSWGIAGAAIAFSNVFVQAFDASAAGTGLAHSDLGHRYQREIGR